MTLKAKKKPKREVTCRCESIVYALGYVNEPQLCENPAGGDGVCAVCRCPHGACSDHKTAEEFDRCADEIVAKRKALR